MRLAESLFYAADRQLKAATLSLMQPIPKGMFLDCGCGDGVFTEAMVQKVKPARVMVIDSSLPRLYALNGWTKYYSDLNAPLPIRSNYVDILHAGQIIEHLNDTDFFLREIARVLKPNGYAVITTPNLGSWHNIFTLALGRQPRTCMVSDQIEYEGANEYDKGMPKHRRMFTPKGLCQALELNGLKVLAVAGAGSYLFPALGHPVYVIVKAGKNGQ